MSLSLAERAAGFLETRLSRRSMLGRVALAGAALATDPLRYVLRPGTAYEQLCYCGSPECSCGSTCCAGYTQFCCTLNNGYNFCPDGTLLGGWWQAQDSTYCPSGTRYYLDCNAVCRCDSGCGGGYPFCDTGCDGLTCECALGTCDNYLTGCFQFRYGQCNANVACLGRIKCRVVSCVEPWLLDDACSNVQAFDDYTAEQNVPCNTAVPKGPPPPPPPPPPCHSAGTHCEVRGFAPAGAGGGYRMVTSFGLLLAFGNAKDKGDLHNTHLAAPIVAMSSTPSGSGYLLFGADGGVFAFGESHFEGSSGAHPPRSKVVGAQMTPNALGYYLATADGEVLTFGDAGKFGPSRPLVLHKPIVGIALTPTGKGYWLVGADGAVFSFGDARYHGTARAALDAPAVGIAATPTGQGYWIVTAKGEVVARGDAKFLGSTGTKHLSWPIVAVASAPKGQGYWLVGADGGVFTFGDAHYHGSPV